MNADATWWSDFPGASLVQQGLADFAQGRRTAASFLISIASPRLSRHGLIAQNVPIASDAEIALYETLCQEPGDAYGRYNSMLRELVSFEHALDRFAR